MNMGLRIWLLFVISLVLGCGDPLESPPIKAPAITKRQPRHKKPPVPNGALFRPVFETIHGPVSAGTAFVVELPGIENPILLSALHLLGPDGGALKTIKGPDVKDAVTKIKLQGMFGDRRDLEFDADAISIPDTACIGTVCKHGDVIAFRLPVDAEVTPLKCSDELPPEGESVWLFAELMGGAPRSQKLHRAAAIEVMDGDFMYGFVNKAMQLQATSGAAVLNSKGEAIAINLGGGQGKDQILYGAGNPIGRFRSVLMADSKD